EGQTVPIQTIVGVIDAAGSAAASSAPAPAKAAAPAPAKAPAATASAPAAPRPAAPVPAPVVAAPASSGSTGERIHSSPLVRRMAKEHGIDLSTIEGTGAGGRISKQDIEAVIASPGAPAVAAPGYAAPAPATSSRPAPPPAAAAAPAVSGGQVHVALETAVAREKMYFGNYEVQPMSTM